MKRTLIAVAVFYALRAWHREAALEARRRDNARRHALTMAGGDA